ncbi:MAG: DUF3604 domain-containing protein [Bryobacterales bacterium]
MAFGPLSRRAFLATTAGALAAATAPAQRSASTYRTYFGDLHNHNAIGYAQGSLRRTFEIARNHLDFFAFTPHGYWPDIGHYQDTIEDRWINGFAVVKERWPEVLSMAQEFDDPGKFSCIVGYERHSTEVGDYHILFPELEAPYERHTELADFQKFAKKHGALLIPHHPANRRGERGADPNLWDSEVSPLLEIYSEWGAAEHDRAPYPYKRHTHGGRWTQNTMQWFLAEGRRFGVLASTDDHLGYPGGYREGLAAIKATDLTREALFEAMRARRTYAVTGDRIELDFSVNGAMMGSETPFSKRRTIRTAVSGWDPIDRVEILANNQVIHRDHPIDRRPTEQSWRKPVLLRFEYGWGPWAALAMARTFDWDIDIAIEGGKLVGLQPCFTPGPLSEGRRDRIVRQDESGARIISFTALKQQVDDFAQKAVVLKIQGDPSTRVKIRINGGKGGELVRTLGEQAESNEMLYTGPYPNESAMLHRVVFADHYETEFEVAAEGSGGDSADWYYARVVQTNDQLAWSSPVWVSRA